MVRRKRFRPHSGECSYGRLWTVVLRIRSQGGSLCEIAYRLAGRRQPLPNPAPAADRYPIDLAAALQLGGANHLQIAVAAEQVREAASRLDRAEVMWIPTIDFGAGYARHEGQIQASHGEVVEVSRSAAFVGGGPNVGSAPLTGLSGGQRGCLSD